MSRLPAWVYDHPEVWTSPHRQGGEPCVRGTRIPVEIILNLIADHPDCPNSEILTYYPSAAEHQIQALREAQENQP